MAIFRTIVIFALFISAGFVRATENKTISSELFSGLETMDGKTATISPTKNKRLVYYWASWCPNCRDSLSAKLPKLAERPDLDVIAINTDKDIGRAKHCVERDKIPLQVYRDSKQALSQALEAKAVPFWALLEKDGKDWKVLHAEEGSNKEKLDALLQ